MLNCIRRLPVHESTDEHDIIKTSTVQFSEQKRLNVFHQLYSLLINRSCPMVVRVRRETDNFCYLSVSLRTTILYPRIYVRYHKVHRIKLCYIACVLFTVLQGIVGYYRVFISVNNLERATNVTKYLCFCCIKFPIQLSTL
jgi:heme A synthase